MSHLTFAEAEYAGKKRKTPREVFLERMDKLVPWEQLEREVARHYQKGEQGRPPYPVPVILRAHCLQLFYNLSDPAMEDALYEIESKRRFAGLRLLDRLPDETTILNFRHFLERHGLAKELFKTVNEHLEKNGLMLREGSIVDATIISAKRVFGDADYRGIHKRDEHKNCVGTSWFIARRPGERKSLSAALLQAEQIKASVRAKVEHPFRYIRQVFGYSKVRYRGLAKNAARLHLLAAFGNLLKGEKYLLA